MSASPDNLLELPTRLDVPAAEALLAREDIAYLHVRSASNNCYHLRIERQV